MKIEVKKVKLSEIKLNPDNPRTISTKDMGLLVKSLQEFPEMMEIREVVCDEDYVVIGGNMRTLALRKAGASEVIAKIVTGLTPEQKREFVIKDNSEFGTWDMDLLSTWDDLPLTDWGVDLPEDWMGGGETTGLTDPDAVPEVPKVAITKPGDIWLLGKHRVMCGDSTKAEDVERLMDGVKAAVLFVDPPYGMKYNPNMSDTLRHKKGNWQAKINNYSPVIADDKDFDPSFLQELFKYCKEQFWWGADYYAERLIDKNKGSWIVWDKRKGIEDMEWSTSEFELCWSKARHHRQIARITWSGILGTEQEFDHSDGRKHPTQKPILLVRWFIEKFSKEDDVIADLFGGSGSTLIAAEQTGRTAYLMEIDCLYCDVIINRYLQFVGIDGKVFLSTNDKEAIPYEEVCKMRKGKATL